MTTTTKVPMHPRTAAVEADPAPELLDGPDGAVLVAHLRGDAGPQNWWPNDDRDAFAVALGQRAIALGLVDDDQDGQDVELYRSLTAYLDALRIEPVEFAWLPSTEEAFNDSLGAVPPAAERGGFRMFLLGEPMVHNDHGRPVYRAHRTQAGKYYVGNRYITIAEFHDLPRLMQPTKVESR
jgi:hypothetical protein